MNASDIIIDPEFEALCPPLNEAELEELDKSILARGVRDPLVVWEGENILLDGHNRLRIAKKYNLPFKVEVMDTANRNTAKNFIILNQLGRRNLSPQAASLLRGKLHNARKKERTDNLKQNSPKYQNDPSGPSTAEAIAKETGVSPATVKRDAAFAKAAAEQGKEAEVMAGKAKRKDVVKKKPKAKKKTAQPFGGQPVKSISKLGDMNVMTIGGKGTPPPLEERFEGWFDWSFGTYFAVSEFAEVREMLREKWEGSPK